MVRDTNRLCELLAAKSRIEDWLLASGIEVDAQCRDSIGWAMAAFVDEAGLEIEDAADRVIAAYLDTLQEPQKKAA